MTRVVPLAAAAAMLVSSQPAWATFNCTGTVNASYVTYDGAVIIRGSWRNEYTQICNIRALWNGIPPDVCASWKAMADAAVSLERQMNIYYYDDYTCGTIPTYTGSPSPVYLMLL